jgi:hypothetical protein
VRVSAVVVAPSSGGFEAEPAAGGEWVCVDRTKRSDLPVLCVVTRVAGTVAGWRAGIAAARGDVLVLAEGTAPTTEAIERHAAAYTDPRLGAWVGEGLWSARRSAIDELAGLDRGFGGRGWFAALDVASRLSDRSWDVRVDGSGIAAPQTIGEWEQWAWNAARYARKHRQYAVVRAGARAGAAVVARGRADALPRIVDALVGGTFGRAAA